MRTAPRLLGLLLVPTALALAACGPSKFDLPMEDLSPEDGWSLRIPEFEVPYGDEVQDCYFIEVPRIGDSDEFWVSRSLIGMNPGSHHFNMYRVTAIRELRPEDGVDVDMGGIPAKLVSGGACFDSSNFNEWPLIVNSQVSTPEHPYLDWNLPDGVAFKLTAGEIIMLQPHYVNVAEQSTDFSGQVKVNFYRAPYEDPIELGTLFATQQSIRVCESNPDVTYHGTCSFSPETPVTLAAINGHFHLRGERFTVYTWDGVSLDQPEQEFYESFAWEDPIMKLDLDEQVPQGGGIWWTCEYQWREPTSGCDIVNENDEEQQGDCCYTFGPHVEYQEHCNVFLYYYPRQETGDIFCN